MRRYRVVLPFPAGSASGAARVISPLKSARTSRVFPPVCGGRGSATVRGPDLARMPSTPPRLGYDRDGAGSRRSAWLSCTTEHCPPAYMSQVADAWNALWTAARPVRAGAGAFGAA